MKEKIIEILKSPEYYREAFEYPPEPQRGEYMTNLSILSNDDIEKVSAKIDSLYKAEAKERHEKAMDELHLAEFYIKIPRMVKSIVNKASGYKKEV